MFESQAVEGDGFVVRKFLPALILLLAPQSVLAQGFCTAPVPPPPLDGAAATPEQLRAAIARAREFIGQANLYENCLTDEIKAAQARAATGGSATDLAMDKDAQDRIAANRRLKDRISSEAASAMDAYKKAHPN